MVVQGEDNLSRLVGMLSWGVHGWENVPNKERQVQDGS